VHKSIGTRKGRVKRAPAAALPFRKGWQIAFCAAAACAAAAAAMPRLAPPPGR
jgi:hypothetical protein